MAKSFEIHPAIGVARVGDSDTGFALGPEPGLQVPASFRDQQGRIKPQAARFRVYQCERDANGRIVSATEITGAAAQITWTVHLVNRKGAAPRLAQAGRRNNATGNDASDASFINDPGERVVTGAGQRAVFDTGKFMGQTIPLGEIRTDADGRLLVLGGHGKSGFVPSAPPQNQTIQNFANNDFWFDDTSDGPVRATVKLADGTTQQAAPAWVVVGPPDFAPEIMTAVTWYDVAFQAAVDNGLMTAPAKPSFKNDIFPILNRLVDYQWVNDVFAADFGPGGAFDFASKWAALSDPAQEQQTRQNFFKRLRNPAGGAQTPKPSLPPVHDDVDSSGGVVAFTRAQYGMLQQWAAGNFINDFATAVQPPLSDPEALDRAALLACVGGPFFPGIEVGKVIADKTRYDARLPFRFDPAKLKPGEVTQGNALPWQADFFDCAQEGPLAWWPSQRPDLVPTPQHPNDPQDWALNVGSMDDMVKLWNQLGFLVRNAAGSPAFIEVDRKLNPASPR